MTRIYTKKGRLSAYGLSCGYVERETKITKETDAKLLSKELYKEGNVYYVRQFSDATCILWEGKTNLKDALKLYNSINL